MTLIDNCAIWLQSKMCLLIKIKASFLRYTGYLTFIINPYKFMYYNWVQLVYNFDLNVIKYCETVSERNGKTLNWYIKNSVEILNKLKSKCYPASSLTTHDFSTLDTTTPHNRIKEKIQESIEQTFKWAYFIWLVYEKRAFYTSEQRKIYNIWSGQKVCDALQYILDNMYFIRFGSNWMDTNCALLVADLFFFCFDLGKNSCFLFLTITKLMLLNHSSLPQDI